MSATCNKRVSPWLAAVSYVLCFAWLFFGERIVAVWLGGYASIVGELFILLTALAPVAISGARPSDVFRFHRVRGSQVGGSIIMYAAGTYISASLIMLLSAVLPVKFSPADSGLQMFISSQPLWAVILIICVLPAFCEEALFRGTILNSLSDIKSRLLTALIVGVLFGLIHMNIYRSISTGVLGAVFAIIVLETNSMLIPMCLHFINNLLSTLVLKSADVVPTLSSIPGMSSSANSGIVLIVYSAAPLALFGGYMLLKKRSDKPATRVKAGFITALAASALMAAAGVMLLAFGGAGA